ncbi:MAG: DnaJ domain-containing protein [Clostridia bacterium]|nr:DnaJ domain-containing protein [Clostridia bacterium]
MKNYYEILEIAKNASPEIIDKAHKILVKKYHPDLQTTPQEKSICEAKIKEINEAYDVLSNKDLRNEYDAKLTENEQFEKDKIIQEQLKQELNYKKNIQKNQEINNNDQNNLNNTHSNSINTENAVSNSNHNHYNAQFQKDYEAAINQAYHDAYIQDMKNRGYKIKYKKTWNERLRSLIALLITIGVIVLILQIPVVKNYFISLYKDNELIHNIVDGIASWFH